MGAECRGRVDVVAKRTGSGDKERVKPLRTPAFGAGVASTPKPLFHFSYLGHTEEALCRAVLNTSNQIYEESWFA